MGKKNPKKVPGLGKDEREWEFEAKVVERAKGKRAIQAVPTKEVVNVIADTFERLNYFAGNAQRVNCEDRALQVFRGIKFEFTEDGHVMGGDPLASIREREYDDPPLCKEHDE